MSGFFIQIPVFSFLTSLLSQVGLPFQSRPNSNSPGVQNLPGPADFAGLVQSMASLSSEATPLSEVHCTTGRLPLLDALRAALSKGELRLSSTMQIQKQAPMTPPSKIDSPGHQESMGIVNSTAEILLLFSPIPQVPDNNFQSLTFATALSIPAGQVIEKGSSSLTQTPVLPDNTFYSPVQVVFDRTATPQLLQITIPQLGQSACESVTHQSSLLKQSINTSDPRFPGNDDIGNGLGNPHSSEGGNPGLMLRGPFQSAARAVVQEARDGQVALQAIPAQSHSSMDQPLHLPESTETKRTNLSFHTKDQAAIQEESTEVDSLAGRIMWPTPETGLATPSTPLNKSAATPITIEMPVQRLSEALLSDERKIRFTVNLPIHPDGNVLKTKINQPSEESVPIGVTLLVSENLASHFHIQIQASKNRPATQAENFPETIPHGVTLNTVSSNQKSEFNLLQGHVVGVLHELNGEVTEINSSWLPVAIESQTNQIQKSQPTVFVDETRIKENVVEVTPPVQPQVVELETHKQSTSHGDKIIKENNLSTNILPQSSVAIGLPDIQHQSPEVSLSQPLPKSNQKDSLEVHPQLRVNSPCYVNENPIEPLEPVQPKAVIHEELQRDRKTESKVIKESAISEPDLLGKTDVPAKVPVIQLRTSIDTDTAISVPVASEQSIGSPTSVVNTHIPTKKAPNEGTDYRTVSLQQDSGPGANRVECEPSFSIRSVEDLSPAPAVIKQPLQKPPEPDPIQSVRTFDEKIVNPKNDFISISPTRPATVENKENVAVRESWADDELPGQKVQDLKKSNPVMGRTSVITAIVETHTEAPIEQFDTDPPTFLKINESESSKADAGNKYPQKVTSELVFEKVSDKPTSGAKVKPSQPSIQKDVNYSAKPQPSSDHQPLLQGENISENAPSLVDEHIDIQSIKPHMAGLLQKTAAAPINSQLSGERNMSQPALIIDSETVSIPEIKVPGHIENEIAPPMVRNKSLNRSDLVIVDQVVRATANQKHHLKSEIKIRLLPENLGEVHLKVSATADGIMAEIRAANGATQETLQKHVSQLHTMLQDTGLKIDQIVIRSFGSEFQSENRGQQQYREPFHEQRQNSRENQLPQERDPRNPWQHKPEDQNNEILKVWDRYA